MKIPVTKIANAIPFALLVFALLPISAFAQEPTESLNRVAPAEPPAMGSKEDTAAVKGSLRLPRVYFVNLKDGQTVQKKFVVKFGIDGMKVKPASGQAIPGEGHYHLIIDAEPIPKGETIPSDDHHLRFEKGQTEAEIKLKPGEHVLTIQFADGLHRAYGEMLTNSVKVQVRK